MAQIAPDSVDVTDLQFKLQSKVKLFNAHDGADLNCHNLLAAASSHGLIFCGSTSADLRVVQISSLADETSKQGTPVATRVVPLPSKAFQVAVNCDHSLLAVDVTKNGNCFLQIYSVPSFYANDVTLTHEFPIQGSCHSSQLLWNPVQNDVLAVVTENGGLVMYTLKSPGVELCSLDGQQTVQSACWSPKGKQIVAGFPNGNLIQFKPDLKPARSIPCPPNLLGGAHFDTIAIQWLATYQFAAVFQSKSEDTTPALFIVNAPKTGNAVYINYDDICYSQSGPRKSQVFLSHILQWNLLIVASANSMEVGILGTTEQGDFPTWKQFVPADNARAELPLTSSKQETFPLGLALEVGVTHQITIGEQIFPVMPMIHLLSTDGLLISFNLLNTMPNFVGICCPPNPIRNNTGLIYFKVPELTVSTPPVAKPVAPAPVARGDLTFSLGQGNATSTPAPPVKSLFGNMSNEPPKSAQNLFGSLPASKPPAFGGPPVSGSTGFGFSGLGLGQTPTTTADKPPPPAFGQVSKPFGFGSAPPPSSEQRPSAPAFGLQSASLATSENKEPLITVPPTYTAATKPPQNKPQTSISGKTGSPSDQPEDTKIVQGMIREEIDNFQKELKDLIARSRAINITIGTKEEQIVMAKDLNELSKLNKEATEVNDSLGSDVHSLRVNLNETFAMVAEAKNKHKLYTTQNHLQTQNPYPMSQTSKRQLSRLESLLKMSESQLFVITRQIDAQWAEYQDMQHQRTKHTMKIPSLEGVYQTISKQRDILAKHRSTLNNLKQKMGMRETVKALEITKQDPVESLTDSILSMSIIDQVQRENEKLNPRKLELLKECLKRHKTQIVKPNRPDRLGINSEVVQEKREHMRKIISDKARAEKKQEKPKLVPNPVAAAPLKPAEPLKQPPQVKFEMPKKTTPANVPVMSKPIAQKPTPFGFSTASSSPQTEPPKFSFAQLTPQAAQPAFGSLATTTPFSTTAQKLGTEGKSELPKPSFADSTTKTAPSSAFSFGGLGLGKTTTVEPKADVLFGTTTITPVVKPVAAAVVTEEKAKEEPKPSMTLTFGGTPGGLFGSTSGSTPGATSFFGGFGQKTSESNKKEDKPLETMVAPKSPLASLVETVNKQEFAPSSITTTTTEQKPDKPTIFSLSKESSVEKEVSTKPGSFSFGFGGADNGNSSVQNVLESTPKALSEASTASLSPKSSEFNFSTASKGLDNKTPGASTIEPKPATTGFNLSFGGLGTSTVTSAPNSATISTTPTTKPSIFGSITPLSAPAATKPTTGLFSTTPSSGTGLFGSSAASPDSTVPQVAQTVITSTATSPTTPPTGTGPTDGLFSSFNICSPTSPNSNQTSQSASSIFGASTGFGTTPSQPSNNSIFGGGDNSNKSSSIFGTTTQPTQTPSPFGAAIPKPEQSVFGGGGATPSASSIFGQANAATPPATASPFGQQNTTSSIFGGGTTATTAASSPFGSNTAAATTTNSPFGNANAATAPASNSPFGGSASIFGSNAAQTQSSPFGQPQQTSAFSQGGSLFGGNSTFGAGGATTGSGGFGFGGQSQAQQPVFGGNATFGSPPAFGGSAFSKPSFGGAPTFGAKPLFGSPTQPTAQNTVPTNSLFEQLGSQGSGPTFGNLAQTSPPQQQQQQPPPSSFGGSAFSSWR